MKIESVLHQEGAAGKFCRAVDRLAFDVQLGDRVKRLPGSRPAIRKAGDGSVEVVPSL